MDFDAEPVIDTRLMGTRGSFIETYFPAGLRIRIGPILFTALGLAGVFTLLFLLGLLCKKLAPDEFTKVIEAICEILPEEDESVGGIGDVADIPVVGGLKLKHLSPALMLADLFG